MPSAQFTNWTPANSVYLGWDRFEDFTDGPYNVQHSAISDQVVMEAWRKSAIGSLDISKTDFVKIIEHHGWRYDENGHYWVKGRDSERGLFDS